MDIPFCALLIFDDCIFIFNFYADDDKHNHEESAEKLHGHMFDENAEKMIKKVKHALEQGEGCRVCLSYPF